MGFLWVLLSLLVLLWVWAIVDCVRRPLDSFPTKLTPGQWDKLAWLGVLVVLNLLGALLYWGLIILQQEFTPTLSEEGRHELRQAIDEHRKEPPAPREEENPSSSQ